MSGHGQGSSDQVRSGPEKIILRKGQDIIISGQVMSSQGSTRSCQVRSGKVKSDQAMSKSGQASTDQGISDQDMVRSAQVIRSGQDRSWTGQIRSG